MAGRLALCVAVAAGEAFPCAPCLIQSGRQGALLPSECARVSGSRQLAQLATTCRPSSAAALYPPRPISQIANRTPGNQIRTTFPLNWPPPGRLEPPTALPRLTCSRQFLPPGCFWQSGNETKIPRPAVDTEFLRFTLIARGIASESRPFAIRRGGVPTAIESDFLGVTHKCFACAWARPSPAVQRRDATSRLIAATS